MIPIASTAFIDVRKITNTGSFIGQATQTLKDGTTRRSDRSLAQVCLTLFGDSVKEEIGLCTRYRGMDLSESLCKVKLRHLRLQR